MRKDIDLSFIRHPLTKDLSVKTGSSAIAQSLRNIVLTSFYERGFNVEFGTNTNSSLFDLMDNLNIQTLKGSIRKSIETFEPSVEVIELSMKADRSNNTLELTILYTEYNNPVEKITTIDLTRLR